MDDMIRTFTLESTGLRGRIVRLGPALDAILGPHGYPEAVSRLTSEAATLTALLSSMLKFEGIFTLQAQGDGPVAMVVADLTSGGDLRACATIREGREENLPSASEDMLGKGYLAFTVDQGAQTERYQGIVELKPGPLSDSVQSYFRQSEQIVTGLKMAVSYQEGRWRAGGILIQKMPEEGGHAPAHLSNAEEDGWRRTMVLLESCTDAELTDSGLPPEDVLYRLFHEETVRVFEPQQVRKGCRCSAERLQGILKTMAEEDRRDMLDNGKITMSCQFCSRHFVFHESLDPVSS